MRTRMLPKHRTVQHHLATKSLTAEQFEGFHTNYGAEAAVTLTLPKARDTRGMRAEFMRSNASYALILNPRDDEQIIDDDGTALTAGFYESLAADGSSCVLWSDGTRYFLSQSRGTVTAET